MLPRLAPALLLLAACKFPYPPDVGDDEPDAARQCEPSTIVCDDARGEYVACSAAGTVDLAMVCPLGCAPDEEKCLDIDPHNGLAMYLDMVPNPPDLILNGPATIETFGGAILDRGVGVVVPTFVHQLPNGTSLRVLVVKDFVLTGALSFPQAVPADVRYQSGIAIVATGSIDIRGPIDVSATGITPGPGGHVAGSGEPLPCAGVDVSAAPPIATRGASGGGGNTVGGSGGEASGTSATPGGAARAAIEPLDGGCFGGTVYNNTDGTIATGGSGGGALQLTSRSEIRISGAGLIDASGSGGRPAYRVGGGGGGAGGAVMLEAPQVVLDGSSVIVSTKGGGGAGGSITATLGGEGAAGGTDATPARGGTSPSQAVGGPGGADTAAQGGAYYQGSSGSGGGGGGGAAGITAVFTGVGAIAPQNGAAIRGGQMVGLLRTRLVP